MPTATRAARRLSSSSSSSNSYRARNARVAGSSVAHSSAAGGPVSLEKSFVGGSHMPLNMDASPTKGSRRTIRVTTLDVVGLRTPANVPPVNAPQITIGLGKASQMTGVGTKNHADAFVFEDPVKTLPFNGEEFLRFMMTSGTFQLAYGDAPISDMLIGDRWDGLVTMYGKGLVPCGVVRVLIEKTGERVEPGLDTNVSTINTRAPPSPVSGASPLPLTVDDSDVESLGMLASDVSYRSVWVNIINGRGLVNGKKKSEFAASPFVTMMLGKEKLRTSPVTATSDQCTFDQSFVFPYNQQRGLKFDCRDDKKMSIDPKVGSTTLDLQKFATSGSKEHRVAVPLKYDGAANGILNVVIEFSEESVSKAQLLTKTYGSRDVRSLESAANVDVAKDKVDSSVRSVTRSVVIDGVHTTEKNEDSPFVKVQLASDTLRVEDAGPDGVMRERMYFPYAGHKWMKVTLQNDVKMGRDPVIGSGLVNMSDFVGREGDNRVTTPVYDDDGRETGRVSFMMTTSCESIEKAKIIAAPKAGKRDGLMPSQLSTSPCKSYRLRPAEITKLSSEQTPYLVGTFGKKSVRCKSITQRQPNGDALCPEEFIYPYEPYKECEVVLWDDIKLGADQTLGSATLDMDELLVGGRKEIDVPFVNEYGREVHSVKFVVEPLNENIKKAYCQKAREIIPGGLYKSVELLIQFADDMVDPKPTDSDIIDPYVKIDHGSASIKGKQKKDAGLSPIFMETFKLPIQPGQPMKLSVYDKEGLSKDVLVGSAELPLPPLDMRYHTQQVMLELEREKKMVGRLWLKMSLSETAVKKAEYIPSSESYIGKDPLDFSLFETTPLYSSYIVRIVQAQDLVNPKPKVDTLDPYVSLSNGANSCDTPVHKNQGCNPTFGEAFIFPTIANRFLRLNVKDDALGKDPLLGTGKIDLEDVVCEEGILHKLKVVLKDMKGKRAGDVYVEVVPSNEKVTKADKYAGSTDLSAFQIASVNKPVYFDKVQVGADGSNTVTQQNKAPGSVFEQPSQVQSLYKSMEVEIVKITGVTSPTPEDVIDPYINCTFGQTKLSGQAQENAGGDASIDDVFHLPYENYQYLKIEVLDHNHLHKDRVLGVAKINLDSFVTQSTSQQKLKVALQRQEDNSPAGIIYLKLRFHEDMRVNKAFVEHISRP